MVERQLPKLNAVGSTPITRFGYYDLCIENIEEWSMGGAGRMGFRQSSSPFKRPKAKQFAF